MKTRMKWVVLALLAAPAGVEAQHGGGARPVRTPPREATQFNFLVGQWELVVKPAAASLGQRIHGVPKLVGTWKGWKALDGFGIEDELRITDNSGNPMTLAHAVRYYDGVAKQWKTSTVDVYRGVITLATGQMRGDEMNVASQGKDAEGKPYLSRARYTDITPASFRFLQERSTDNGKSWKENLTIEAKKVSASASR